jgi:ABC-type oligopeptide transport system substrate-binding subunit
MPGTSLWKTAAGATAIVLLVAGCSSGGSDNDAVPPNTVVIGIGEPDTLIPSNSTETNGSQVLSSLFYPLVNFDADKKPVLVAADSITPDKDNRVWTIKIKPGFTFSNGEPVTSDNYLDAWNYGTYAPNAQAASYFFARIDGYADLQSKDPDGPNGPEKAPAPKANALSGLKKVDDTTFTVTLSAPFAGWESVLGYSAFYPLPKAAFKEPGVLADGFGDAPIGNGPFKMKGTWQHDDKVQVEKVADFKGLVPKVDGITWKIYQDQGAEYADLLANNVDVQTQIPIESLSSASAELGNRFAKSPNSVFAFVAFPMYQPDYQNPNVRRAISMAVNRKEMTDQIFNGSQTPATSFVSPVVAGYRENSCGKNCEYNPVEAKKLYAANNGPNDIRISYNADGPHKAWIDAMCNQIKSSLGVNCTGVGEPKLSDLLAKVKKHEPIGMFRLSWVMDYPLMESYLGPLFATDGSSNDSGYSNPTFDSLVKAGSEAATPDEAIKKWQAAEDILVQDMPIIPLRFGQNVYGYSEKVTNVEVDLFQQVNIYKIEVVS